MNAADEQFDADQPGKPVKAACRVCNREIDPASPSAPFCSDRCRMADLGKWLSGDYRISRELKDVDLDADD